MKIFCTSTFSTPFIRDDFQYLAGRYVVRTSDRSGLPAFLSYISGALWADITFSWFASTYSAFLVFLARLMKKPSIIAIGGVDVAHNKELHYGIWTSRWKSFLVRYGITHATAVIPVAESLKLQAMRLCHYSGSNIQVVPTSFDHNFWKRTTAKESTVLMVAAVPNRQRFMIKGVDRYFALAEAMKNVRFILVGITFHPPTPVPANVELIDYIPRNQLGRFYSKAKVFCQLSRHEGLPNSLCEAMLCECIPVCTPVGAMPEVVGESGFIVAENDLDSLVRAVQAACEADDAKGSAARENIRIKYAIGKRESMIEALLQELTR